MEEVFASGPLLKKPKTKLSTFCENALPQVKVKYLKLTFHELRKTAYFKLCDDAFSCWSE